MKKFPYATSFLIFFNSILVSGVTGYHATDNVKWWILVIPSMIIAIVAALESRDTR